MRAGIVLDPSNVYLRMKRFLLRALPLALCVSVVPMSSSSAQVQHYCSGLTATLVGTSGNDSIRGTRGNDVIVARAGTDTIRGLGGNDVICAGAGDDRVVGGKGRDRIDLGAASLEEEARGGAGRDHIVGSSGYSELGSRLVGGGGDDTLVGRSDSTRTDLIGGAGDDLLDGPGYAWAVYRHSVAPVDVDLSAGVAHGAGNDVLVDVDGAVASRGDDILRGDDGSNFLYGLSGDDTIAARGDDDWLYAGNGSDTIRGGRGGDRLDTGYDEGGDLVVGGHGRDLMVDSAGNDSYGGGAGRDTLTFLFSPNPVLIDLSMGTAAGNGSDFLNSIEWIGGSTFSDEIRGSDRGERFFGGSGSDLIDARGGDDKVSGEAGDDALDGGAGTDDVNGGAGIDSCVHAESRRRCEAPRWPSTRGQDLCELATATSRRSAVFLLTIVASRWTCTDALAFVISRQLTHQRTGDQ